MYFKNATIYGLDTANISAEHLADKISIRRFQPCGSQDMVSRGWTSPTDDDRFVLAVTGQFLFSMTVEQKILPAAVINQVAAAKAGAIDGVVSFACVGSQDGLRPIHGQRNNRRCLRPDGFAVRRHRARAQVFRHCL